MTEEHPVIYLDNSATTKPSEASIAAMTAACRDFYGNPSSLHSMGFEAEREMKKAAGKLAATLGVQAGSLLFTSGGTEANNLAVTGTARAKRREGNRIVTTAVEHHSILEPTAALEAEGFEVIRLSVDSRGRIDPAEFRAAVNQDTILVSMMQVNNECGFELPIKELCAAAKRINPRVIFHCDGVQAYGKLAVNLPALGVDLYSLSGHKIHAPKGAGALWQGKNARLVPLVRGGRQQRGIRPGTESVPLICALGAAAEEICAARPDTTRKMKELSSYFREKAAALPFVKIKDFDHYLPSILNFSADGIKSETLIHFLAQRNIFLSGSSACAKGERSHVLTAMGFPQDIVDSSVRVSFSAENTLSDVDALIAGLIEADRSLAKFK